MIFSCVKRLTFSDAVGHSLVDYLKEYAENSYTDDEFEKKCKTFTHAAPFTKESLLYREIFEQFYPGQGEMIKDSGCPTVPGKAVMWMIPPQGYFPIMVPAVYKNKGVYYETKSNQPLSRSF